MQQRTRQRRAALRLATVPLAQGAALVVALAGVIAPGFVSAEGLRVGLGGAALRFPCSDPAGIPGDYYFTSISARVSRGRAAMSLGVPLVLSNAPTAAGQTADGSPVLGCGTETFTTGQGDMSVGLEYNLVQDPAHMFIVTVGGGLRFPTAAAGLGNGTHVATLGLSAVYGLTRQLLLYADLRQGWFAVLAPVRTSIRTGELGVVYWFTDKLGLTANVSATDYAGLGNLPFSVDTSVGFMFEAIPGVMMNAGGVAGLAGAAPQGGGTFGFGFEL